MYRLTPEVEKLIVATVRAGSYAHVAAESAGVPRLLFRRWLERGRKYPRSRYRQFWLSVLQAQAQARAKAEMDARQKDVKFWLRYGPGKDEDDFPGWMPAGKGTTRRPRQQSGPADFFRLLGALLDVLTPFPEARQAVVQAFGENNK